VKRTLIGLVGCLIAAQLLLAVPQALAWEVPQNLENLVSRSYVAFTGKCLSAVAKVQGRFLVTTYTFQVEEVLKGDVGATYTFTQLGASKEEALRLRAPSVGEFPVYQVNSDYTLFLGNASSIGLQSPVGVTQGVVKVTTAADGSRQIQATGGNEFLFRGMKVSPAVSKALSTGAAGEGEAAVDYKSFVDMVKQLRTAEPAPSQPKE
jgi:hypothetical protein